MTDLYSAEELAPALDSLDDAVNYAAWIIDEMRPHLGPSILEVGAGTGTMTERLADIGSVVATEPDARFAARLAERFEGTDIAVEHGDLATATRLRKVDSVVMVNVLEHIEDDADALRQCFESLNVGGHLAVYVPAFQLLFSEFDASIGHFRRYRKKALIEAFQDAGFTVVKAQYMNVVGWFAWLILARLLRRPPAVGRQVIVYDRFVIPVLRRIESIIRPPFGQSVLVVGQKPALIEQSGS